MFKEILSHLYSTAMAVRNYAYDKNWLSEYKSNLPVICVGNVTAGGNGKTPLVIWLAEKLKALGERPVILSRGYGGSLRGPYLVDPADKFEKTGDEPLMMARCAVCPVVIARSRVAGAKWIEAAGLASVIILDDGFQHRALHRAFNLVCIAAGSQDELNKCLAGKLLPAGSLREPLNYALRRANAVILQSRSLGHPQRPAKVIAETTFKSLPVFQSRLDNSRIVDRLGQSVNLKECVLLTSIANPQAVLATLPISVRVIGHRALSDHAPDVAMEIAELKNRFPNVPIVVTDKDLVKISEGVPVYVLKADLQVEDGEALVKLALDA